MTRPFLSRLLHVISIGRITVVNDTATIQTLQVAERPGSDGSPAITDDVLRVAQFGFTSSPPIGADVVLIRLWGNRTLTICIGSNHQASRLRNLQPGDSAVYDVRGAKVLLGPTGIIIDGAGMPLTIQNVGGAINAPGATLTCQDVITAFGVDLDAHTHTGVASGMAVSGPPSA